MRFLDWFTAESKEADIKVGEYAEKHFYQKWQVWLGLVAVATLGGFVINAFW